MTSLTLSVDESAKDFLIAELWEAGTAGITEEDGLVRAFFEDFENAAIVAGRFGSYSPVLREEPEKDWAAESRGQWQPFPVGDRFYVVPVWREDNAPEGRLRLWIDPGMACGSGTHEATQLCLEALEQHMARGAAALDVGTGSGILAQAMKLLGAGSVYACDIDPSAIEIAKTGLRRAGHDLYLFTGSLRSVRGACVDVVVANLNSATLSHLAADIERVTRPGGTIIVSGFLEAEAPRVAMMFRLPIRETLHKAGWACLVLGG